MRKRKARIYTLLQALLSMSDFSTRCGPGAPHLHVALSLFITMQNVWTVIPLKAFFFLQQLVKQLSALSELQARHDDSLSHLSVVD